MWIPCEHCVISLFHLPRNKRTHRCVLCAIIVQQSRFHVFRTGATKTQDVCAIEWICLNYTWNMEAIAIVVVVVASNPKYILTLI